MHRDNFLLLPDSRYSVNQSVECSYDCEVTETLTLSSASCTDTGNKFSVYAENEKGNSTVQSVLNSIYVGCEYKTIILKLWLKVIIFSFYLNNDNRKRGIIQFDCHQNFSCSPFGIALK